MTKYDSNDSLFGSNMILGTPVMNSMTFNVGLQKLYYLMKTNTLKLVVIDTFNLIFYKAYSYDNLAWDLSYWSITLDLVNSQIIFSTYIVGSNKIGVIWAIDQGALSKSYLFVFNELKWDLCDNIRVFLQFNIG